jgi:type II secretory pathway pseudopilin PulG
MKTRLSARNRQRGSTLLAAMIVIVILSFAAAGVLSYSLTTYRNSSRQAILDQAKEVADSEMQYLYYTWKYNILTKASAPGIGTDTYMQSHPGSAPVTAAGYDISTNLVPYAGIAQGVWNGGTWTISRTLQFNSKHVAGSTSTDGSAVGILNATGGQVGKIFYYTAKTRATFTSPVLGTVEFHSGRNFQFSSASLFQYALFYQGELELAAGGSMIISGPISTNASAFVGSSAGNLTLTNNIFFFQNYNGAADGTSGEDGRLEVSGTQTHVNNMWDGTSQTYNGETSYAQPRSLNDPVYNPNPQAAAPADQVGQRAQQVIKMGQQQSFVGGVDVQNALNTYPNAYVNPITGVTDANEVYRAVIAPPPVDGSGNPIAEDPAVAASRLYNSAGVVITINQTGAGATEVQIGTAATPNAYYDTATPAAGVISQAQYNAIMGGVNGGPPNLRQSVVNKREEAGGTPSVNVTTVDVAALNDTLNTLMPGNTVSGSIPTYNGMVYVYDKSNNQNLAATIPALNNTQNAILLKDGAITPNFVDSNGNPYGFTVASNNGVYVQGDYNIKQIDVDGSQATNPSAIMGDAIIAVSAGWNPANSDQVLSSRVATSTQFPINPNATNSDISAADVVNYTDYPDAPLTGNTEGGMTINAAILTGNTPSYVDPLNPAAGPGSNSYNSGGAQNLVRMEEDWYDTGATPLTLTLQGSLGQLFSSDYFRAPYRSNSSWPGIGPGGVGSDIIYEQPHTRLVNYDQSFSVRTPFGTPTTTSFTIGPFFIW